ncbi:MAG TPA: hypothetical protein PKC86_02835 [Candidatus Saccharibacteria bacterium]|nr:hypothetical protein [Candidatus Saccharibacteria bacterium]
MVKKVIVIACLAASLLIFLATINFAHGLIMFLMAGIIPGTNFVLSPTQMLIFMLILTGLFLYRFGFVPLRNKSHQPTTSKKPASKRLSRV